MVVGKEEDHRDGTRGAEPSQALLRGGFFIPPGVVVAPAIPPVGEVERST